MDIYSKYLLQLLVHVFILLKCLPLARAHASSRARRCRSLDGVNDALFNAALNVQQAMTQNIPVTSNDVGRTRKK